MPIVREFVVQAYLVGGLMRAPIARVHPAPPRLWGKERVDEASVKSFPACDARGSSKFS
jgi:hypothetical protein